MLEEPGMGTELGLEMFPSSLAKPLFPLISLVLLIPDSPD
jgi:hypothetical protein